MIQSLMQDVPLTLNLVRERVERLHADKTVTTRYADAIDRACYGDVLARSGQLADALRRYGQDRQAYPAGDPLKRSAR